PDGRSWVHRLPNRIALRSIQPTVIIDTRQLKRRNTRSGKTDLVNVIGHGIDLVDVAEMRRWIDDPRDPLIPRCFVQAELDEIGVGDDRIERLAGRFAAKEAVLKALGTGFGAGVAFTD